MAKLRPQFVLFGDSITQLSFENGGWGAALAALYARQVFLSLLSISTHFFFCILFALVCFVSDCGLGCGKLERRNSAEVVLVVFVDIVVSVFFFTVAL
jgi:hypothetical protein